MFSFGSNRSQSSETDACLLKKDVTFEDLLKCSDISNAYRSNNPKLIGYLVDIDHMKEIYTLLMQTKDRQIHKSVLNLYQTSNMILHRAFADSLELVEFAFKSLDKDDIDHYSPYATGSLARYFSRASDPWPAEIHQTIKASDSLYKLILRNIDNLCIYCTINDLIQQLSSNSYPLGEFIWLLYLAISGDYGRRPPRICFLSTIEKKIMPSSDSHQPLFDPINDKKKIIMSIELMKLYFRSNPKESKLRDFKQIVNNFVARIAKEEPERFIPELLELSYDAGYDETIKQISIAKLTDLYQKDDLGNNFVAACVAYLSICTAHLTIEECLKIIFSILNEKVTQFTLLNIIELVSKVVKTNPEWLNGFADAISHFITYTWNKNHGENQMIVSTLIDIAKAIKNLSISNEFDLASKLWSCEDFISNLDDKPAPDTFTTDFLFPDDLFDRNFVENYNILNSDVPKEIPTFTRPLKDEKEEAAGQQNDPESKTIEEDNAEDTMASLMQSQDGGGY